MKKAADKYIKAKKNKSKMQKGGSLQQAMDMMKGQPMDNNVPAKEENMYEVRIQDDTGLVKYGFSKSIVI